MLLACDSSVVRVAVGALRVIPALRLHTSRAELLVEPSATTLAQPLRGMYLLQPGLDDDGSDVTPPVWVDLPPAFRQFRYTYVQASNPIASFGLNLLNNGLLALLWELGRTGATWSCSSSRRTAWTAPRPSM